MMARAKRIYILIIKIENMYSVFLSSYRNTRESLGELEKAVETGTRLRLEFPQHFSFSQTSTLVSITRYKHGTCFLFLKGYCVFPFYFQLTWVSVLNVLHRLQLRSILIGSHLMKCWQEWRLDFMISSEKFQVQI